MARKGRVPGFNDYPITRSFGAEPASAIQTQAAIASGHDGWSSTRQLSLEPKEPRDPDEEEEEGDEEYED